MTQKPHDGSVRIGPIIGLPSFLEELGCDPFAVLAKANIDPEVFGSPDNLISFEARVRLLNVCAEETGHPHFGLLMGQKSSLQNFGLVGYLALNSPNVESAINSLIHFLRLHVQGSTIHLEITGETAFMGYDIYQETEEPVNQLTEAGVAVLFRTIKDLCGADRVPLEVSFSHRRPVDLKPYQQYFGCPLRFDASGDGVFFPANWLKKRVQLADPELRRLLKLQVDRLEQTRHEEFPDQVRKLLCSWLPSHITTSEQVAELFSVHPRTLHRHLRAHGTSFREIRDQCRFEMAKKMLTSSNREITQIAQMLGYAERRAFSRAFKRWSGTTPACWRTDKGK